MSYEKYYPGGWQSGESGGTPITPEALNHIENGIKQTYSDFAPAGYVDTIYSVSNFDGLLATVNTVLSAMDSKKEARLAFAVSNWTDYIPSGEYLVMVYKEADGYATLTAKCNTAQLQNQLYNGAWGGFEWVNPPMVLGVEYRTTELWNGKAVYTKCVDFGALPPSSAKSVNHGSTGKIFLGVRFVLNNNTPLTVGDGASKIGVSTTAVYLTTTTTFNNTATAQIWYTKD